MSNELVPKITPEEFVNQQLALLLEQQKLIMDIMQLGVDVMKSIEEKKS
jgi:hypothetical protein